MTGKRLLIFYFQVFNINLIKTITQHWQAE